MPVSSTESTHRCFIRPGRVRPDMARRKRQVGHIGDDREGARFPPRVYCRLKSLKCSKLRSFAKGSGVQTEPAGSKTMESLYEGETHAIASVSRFAAGGCGPDCPRGHPGQREG